MSPQVTSAPALNYYDVLEVTPGASPETIRSSFKRLMLECHPDKNPHRRAWSERRVRELLSAYEILANPQSREDFDRKRRAGVVSRKKRPLRKEEKPFFFHKRDPESRALLILYFLLHSRPGAACEILGEMELRFGREFLHKNLDRNDYLDCLFLLGEFYHHRGDYLGALDRLRAIHDHESESRFPRQYMDQVVDLMKDIYLRKLPRTATAEATLRGLREAARLSLSPSEEIVRVCRTAEALLSLGELDEAEGVLHRACEVFPLSKDLARARRDVARALARRARLKEA